MYLNKAFIFGNLTRDPELRSLPTGNKVSSFAVATNRTWKGNDGTKQEATEYHNVVAFGKQAELVAQYMKKGSSIFVEGRMQTRSWDSEGVKKYRTEIVAETIQFGPRAGGSGGYNGGSSSGSSSSTQNAPEESVGTIDYPDDINPEDIPF